MIVKLVTYMYFLSVYKYSFTVSLKTHIFSFEFRLLIIKKDLKCIIIGPQHMLLSCDGLSLMPESPEKSRLLLDTVNIKRFLLSERKWIFVVAMNFASSVEMGSWAWIHGNAIDQSSIRQDRCPVRAVLMPTDNKSSSTEEEQNGQLEFYKDDGLLDELPKQTFRSYREESWNVNQAKVRCPYTFDCAV